jgi:hypothetical protein
MAATLLDVAETPGWPRQRDFQRSALRGCRFCRIHAAAPKIFGRKPL